MHANPNSTVIDLASAAKIGKSTAAKILAKWHKNGSVTRTPGIAEGGRRAAELWAISGTSTGADIDPTEHISLVGDADSDSFGAEQADATAPEPTVSEATNPGAPETVATDLAVSVVASAAPGSDTTPDSVNKDSADKDGGSEKATRLAPFALRGMVEDHLRDHPGEEFGPVAIAKALGGKSSGAVSNALGRLVADGTAVKTKEHPKRFSLASAAK